MIYERDNLPGQTAALAKLRGWIEHDDERVALTCYEAEPCQCPGIVWRKRWRNLAIGSWSPVTCSCFHYATRADPHHGQNLPHAVAEIRRDGLHRWGAVVVAGPVSRFVIRALFPIAPEQIVPLAVPMDLSSGQLALAIAGALFIGVSKTGFGGMGLLTSAIFANLMPAKSASGFVLPMLIFGDLVAVASYHKFARWTHLRTLFPWAAAGVVLGWFTLGRITDHQAKLLIGGIVLVLLVFHLVRRRNTSGKTAEPGARFAPVVGVLAGFATLVANAAGSLMAIYLLALRLPKMEFTGTAAVFFLLLNLFKVPFMANLGLITASSFHFNLLLAPVVFIGALGGRWLLPRVNQRWFENITLVLSALAGCKLLLG